MKLDLGDEVLHSSGMSWPTAFGLRLELTIGRTTTSLVTIPLWEGLGENLRSVARFVIARIDEGEDYEV